MTVEISLHQTLIVLQNSAPTINRQLSKHSILVLSGSTVCQPSFALAISSGLKLREWQRVISCQIPKDCQGGKDGKETQLSKVGK